MVESLLQGLDDKAKIDILLKEYETLRNKIVTRINSRFAIVGYVAGIVALVGTQYRLPDWVMGLLLHHPS